MKKKVNDLKKDLRHRPAMAKSTQARGKFYLKLRNILIIIYIVGFIVSSPILFIIGENPLYVALPIPNYILFILAFILIFSVIILSKRGRRHAAPRFVKLEKPPGVLFLRPFTEDTDLRIYYSWGKDQRPTTFLQKLHVLKFELKLQWLQMKRQAGFELGEYLSVLTKNFGSIAAIGEPGSPPILGADNVYVSDDNWQEQVIEMARTAKLVILTIGTTPGVIWETENMIKIVPPSRLLLNIPGGTRAKRHKNYKTYRAVADNLFPKGLPLQLSARVLTFKDDWLPVEDSKLQPPVGSSAHVAWWMTRVLP